MATNLRPCALLVTGLAVGHLASDQAHAMEGLPFSVADLFAELNDTDGDLGFHALIDGEAWRKLAIETPRGQKLLDVKVRSRLRRQGLTELFFESAEPPFDELPPEQFFRRFPEGEYEISGITLDGIELESAALFSHVMPAPAEDITVSGEAASDDCEVDVPEVMTPVLIQWSPVVTSHPEVGRSGPVDVVKYQVVVEREEPTLLIFSVDLPPDVTEIEVPEDFTALGDAFKFEVLVRDASGNQTAVESCFVLAG